MLLHIAVPEKQVQINGILEHNITSVNQIENWNMNL